MIKYTNEQLLDMIQQYALTYNNIPTVDKMLVSKELFRRRFGSFSKAVELAGLTPNRRTREQMERKCEKCHTKFVAISKNKDIVDILVQHKNPINNANLLPIPIGIGPNIVVLCVFNYQQTKNFVLENANANIENDNTRQERLHREESFVNN